MRVTGRLAIALVVPALFAQAVHGVDIKLTVVEPAGVARTGGTITSGVPFAKGQVRDVAGLSASIDGRPTPAQFLPLARWDDGSIRWALMDVQVDVAAGAKVELVVRDDGRNVPPPTPARVVQTPDAVSVSTGPVEFTIDRKQFNLFRSLKVDGQERLGPAGRGLVLVTADGRQVVAGAPDTVELEQAGPMRATVVLRGKFPGVHNGLLGYTVRVVASAGSRTLKLRVWLENDGRHGYVVNGREDMPSVPEWFAFSGMAVELGLGLGEQVTARCEGVEAVGKLKVLQVCHDARDRQSQAFGYDQMEYLISGPHGELGKGARTDGVVALSGGGGRLTAAIRHFWQNYEKAVELDGATLRLWLWPTEGQWPRVQSSRADATLLPLARKGLYNLPGSVHKGYEMVLDFSGRPSGESSAELSEPLFALASGEYYAATGAAVGLFAPPQARTGDAECDGLLAAWDRMARGAVDPDFEFGLWHARRGTGEKGPSSERGFMFGWMDFGDLAVPARGTSSLHYDWPWIMLLNAMRTGQTNFLRMGEEMIRHRTEIDQDWTDRTAEPYRGLQRAGSTHPHFHAQRFSSNQPNVGTTWLAGVVLFHMLTGDAKALECAQRTAGYLANGWDWSSRPKDTKDYTMRSMVGDMRAVGESMFSYCAMFDLTGERKWLDAAVGLFDRYVVPKWTAHGPHLHQPNQIQSQDYLKQDVQYCYSIQALCELHHRTGHAKLFDLLRAGCDTEFPDNYFDAPLYLAGLNAYVAKVTGESKYAHAATELWVTAFPMSRTPPVYLPDNSTWTRTAAMLLRAGHLLQYSFWQGKP